MIAKMQNFHWTKIHKSQAPRVRTVLIVFHQWGVRIGADENKTWKLTQVNYLIELQKKRIFCGFSWHPLKPHLFTIHLSHQWHCDVFLFWVCFYEFLSKILPCLQLSDCQIGASLILQSLKGSKDPALTGYRLYRSLIIHSTQIFDSLLISYFKIMDT